MRRAWVLGALGALLLALALPAAAAALVAGDAQNGKTVRVHPGDRLTVTLGSVAWTIDAPPGGTVVATGEQTTAVTRPGPGAPGTTSRGFVARAVGTATLTATRTTCGEALQCTPAQGHWSLRVRVLAAPAPAPQQLPHTGQPVSQVALLAAALLLLGSGAVVVGRRPS